MPVQNCPKISLEIEEIFENLRPFCSIVALAVRDKIQYDRARVASSELYILRHCGLHVLNFCSSL